MSCFYLIAWLIMHRMMGNLEPVVISQGGRQPVPLA